MPSRQLIGNNNYNNSKLKISKSLSSVHMIFLEELLLKRWKLILLLSLELIAITFFWLPNNCFLLRVFIYDVSRNLKNVLYDTSLFFSPVVCLSAWCIDFTFFIVILQRIFYRWHKPHKSSGNPTLHESWAGNKY